MMATAIGKLITFPMGTNQSKDMNKKLNTIKDNIKTILGGLREAKGFFAFKPEDIENNCQAGQFRTVYMSRPVKLKKAGKERFPKGLEKVSAFQVQVGIEYEKKAKVIQGRKDGSMPKATRPDWAEYVNGSDCLMRHKTDHSRVYLAAGMVDNPSFKGGSFITDREGNIFELENIRELVLASELETKAQRPWTRIDISNIIELI